MIISQEFVMEQLSSVLQYQSKSLAAKNWEVIERWTQLWCDSL